MITGETAVLEHGGVYYFYVNDWGTCAGIDCCSSSGGCTWAPPLKTPFEFAALAS